jgi:hypothetical protein
MQKRSGAPMDFHGLDFGWYVRQPSKKLPQASIGEVEVEEVCSYSRSIHEPGSMFPSRRK